MRFADVEARVTSAVFRHLANKRAVLDNVEVEGVFDRHFVEVLDGIPSTSPVFSLPTACMPPRVTQGSKLRIPDVGTFRVVIPEPDGTGVTRLRLEVWR